MTALICKDDFVNNRTITNKPVPLSDGLKQEDLIAKLESALSLVSSLDPSLMHATWSAIILKLFDPRID